jgi:hypothetical protein
MTVASESPARYAAWFHELDAWTEYWDLYHPETRGRFYFGDGSGERGLLTEFLPREHWPEPFVAWKRMALGAGSYSAFSDSVRVGEVRLAVLEVDELVARLFAKHFGDADQLGVKADYLEAMLQCGTDTLPAAAERDALVAPTDWRKPTAGRHTIESDIMWFAWALHLEASEILDQGGGQGHFRRALQLAGVAIGCSANFAWRGHRRTRSEYHADDVTLQLLRERGQKWADSFEESATEVHSLLRIREWGHV